jgi:hypothetical protein
VWPRAKLDEFPKAFLNGDLKRHIQQQLFDHESTLMSSTQAFVQYSRELTDLRARISRNEREMKRLQEENDRLRVSIQQLRPPPVSQTPCPQTGCGGFVVDDACGLCGTVVCAQCRASQQPGHVCSEEDVASLREIDLHTKPCPSCGVSIMKLDGCDQMWCVACKTGFDWTSRAVLRTVHNPHYFEYVHSQPSFASRECEVPPADVVRQHVALNFPAHVERVLRLYESIDLVLRLVAPLPRETDLVSNRDLRTAFLEKQLSEEKFKDLLYRRAKERDKKLAYREVLEAYRMTVDDLIRRVLQCAHALDVVTIVDQDRQLRDYFNEQITRLERRYDATLHHLP